MSVLSPPSGLIKPLSVYAETSIDWSRVCHQPVHTVSEILPVKFFDVYPRVDPLFMARELAHVTTL